MKQLTLWPTPEPPIQADPQTIRAVRRTRVAFLRLARLSDASDVPISDWLRYAVRRTLGEVSQLRKAVDPDSVLRMEGSRKRKNEIRGYARLKRKLKALLMGFDVDPVCAYCAGSPWVMTCLSTISSPGPAAETTNRRTSSWRAKCAMK